MARPVFIFITLITIIAVAVFIEIKFPNSPLFKAMGRAIAFLAGIATIMQVLPIDLSDWLSPTVRNSPIVIPAMVSDSASASPSALPLEQGSERHVMVPLSSLGQPIYSASLVSPAADPNWQTGSNADNESGYDGQGYSVRSRKGAQSFFVLNRAKEYDRFVLEVDVTPLTDSQVTAYMIVVGWQEGEHGYLFVVAPDGQCGVAIPYDNGMKPLAKDPLCPIPQTEQTSRVRVELTQENMKAFVDGLFVKEYLIDGYTSGFIGLGVLNYAPLGSLTEAAVRFNNLTIWYLP